MVQSQGHYPRNGRGKRPGQAVFPQLKQKERGLPWVQGWPRDFGSHVLGDCHYHAAVFGMP